MDYAMPQMDGLELLSVFRQNGVNCPAILCSGYLELPERADAIPDATLRKPYTIANLLQTIEQLCTAGEQQAVR